MMIRPQPRLVMAGSAAWVTRNAVVRLRASAACQVARSVDSTVPDSGTGSAAEIMPALLTRMSSRPHCSSAADTSLDAARASVRSPAIPAASKPAVRSSVTLSWIRAVVAAIITAAPSSASRLAVAKPMPSGLPAPVTTATRLDRLNAAGMGIVRSYIGLDARSPGPRKGGSAAGPWPPVGRKIAFGPMVKRPDPLESTPPAFGEEAARQILREGFGVESSSLNPLAGERDQNFRVDPGLPVMRALTTGAGESWVEVPGPDRRTYLARLFTFLPGQVTANTAITTEAIWSHGQLTARLGRALRGFFHPAADYEILWDITHLPKLRPLLTHVSDGPRRAQVEWVLDRFEARVAPALPGLRAQVIHGDMSLDNVLFDDDLRVSGIVDFGDMTHAPLVCDLAVAIADVLHGRDDAIEAAEAIIGGYVSVTPLEDEEAGLLGDLVAARLATEVTVTAWRQGLYPDNAAYAASGEPGARAFLDAIEAEGIDTVARRFREACRRLPYQRSATRGLLERRHRALPRSPLFYEHPVHLVRGEGVWLFDPDDRRYLDCYNNVPVVGHSHPRVVQAVTEQQRLLATHSRYLHEAIVELAERLQATLSPELDAVMVVNSGSEANDLAWRIARAATGRAGAVVTAYAYHGLT